MISTIILFFRNKIVELLNEIHKRTRPDVLIDFALISSIIVSIFFGLYLLGSVVHIDVVKNSVFNATPIDPVRQISVGTILMAACAALFGVYKWFCRIGLFIKRNIKLANSGVKVKNNWCK